MSLTPEAVSEAINAVMAKRPTVMVIVYETPDAIGHVAVPASRALATGLIMHEAARLSPD